MNIPSVLSVVIPGVVLVSVPFWPSIRPPLRTQYQLSVRALALAVSAGDGWNNLYTIYAEILCLQRDRVVYRPSKWSILALAICQTVCGLKSVYPITWKFIIDNPGLSHICSNGRRTKDIVHEPYHITSAIRASMWRNSVFIGMFWPRQISRKWPGELGHGTTV